MEKHDKDHLPRQFNKEFYDVIESFQGQRTLNKPLHVWDIHVEGNDVYIPPPKKHTPKFPIVQTSLLQDLLGDNYILEDNASQGQLATMG
jgi:hypothetical protein